MSGTTELRALLDERGIDYYPKSAYETVWIAANGLSHVMAYDDLIDGCIELHMYPMRPEQVIEATTERTCKPETVSISYCEDAVICSACKTVCDDLESFYYCPNCGAKVVK